MKRLAAIALFAATTLGAQLPPTRADSLLEQGRWAEAESMFYLQSERAPRNPYHRAALGRFLGMKGAVKPGIVLIEEARQFGLDASVARQLIVPLRAIADLREATGSGFTRDSVMIAGPARSPFALFSVSLSGWDLLKDRARAERGRWLDVVDRPVGLDSIGPPARVIGIEWFEAFAPSFSAKDSTLTLHANRRSALSAVGRRHQVLRTREGIRVLMGERRVLPLAAALREMAPSWWQLDLMHGLLVVR